MSAAIKTIWVRAKDINHLVPETTLKNWRQRDKLDIRTGKIGRNGKPVVEFSLQSLEKRKPGIIASYMGAVVESQPSGGSEESSSSKEPETQIAAIERELARFTSEDRHTIISEALRKASVITRWQALKKERLISSYRDGERVPTTQAQELLDEYARCSEEYRKLYPACGKVPHLRSIERVLTDYEANGLLAFIHARQAISEDDGRKAKIHPDLEKWLHRNYAKSRKCISGLQRSIGKESRKNSHWTTAGYQLPSYDWLWRWRQSIPKDALVYHEDGPETWRVKAGPFVARTIKNLRPRQIFQSDHMQFDCFVQFNGKLVRPWLTSMYDLRSGTVPGYTISLQPNSQTIARAWVNAVRKSDRPEYANLCGINEQFYFDNGKDYRSNSIEGKTIKIGAIDLAGEMRVALHTLKVGLVNSLNFEATRYARAYNAQEKAVERWHGTLHKQFDLIQPGYCGSDNKHRPESLELAVEQHKAFISGKRAQSPFLTWNDFVAEFDNWLFEYHQRPRIIDGDRTKVAPLELHNSIATAPHIPTDATLESLLKIPESRVIDRNGIKLHGLTFDHQLLHTLPSGMTRVQIRYNPENLRSIEVFTQHGKLCDAELVDRVDEANPDMALLKRRNEIAKERRETARNYHNEQFNRLGKSDLQIAVEERTQEIEEPIELPIAVNASPVTILTKLDRKHPRPAAISYSNLSFDHDDESDGPSQPPTNILWDEED